MKALLIIFSVIFAGIFGYSIYLTIKAIKNKVIQNDFRHLMKWLLILGLGVSLSFTLMMVFTHLAGGHSPTVYEWLMTIFGSLLFSSFCYISLHAFMLHYYCKNVPEKLDKRLFISVAICFPLAFIAVFILSEGFVDYLLTPYKTTLVYGINFSKGWVTPSTGRNNIAFYAICILSGALYVYFYCDHKMYATYGKHGLLESTFLVAFPAGIIGARLFFVLGEIDKFIGKPFADWVDLTNGGLTILGGALTGIIVGVLWFRWRHKDKNPFIVADLVLPSILIAQAVGRWGNFFNCEVHGIETSMSNWQFLPRIILYNGTFSSTEGFAAQGNFYVPLFFIEIIANLLGFFVLAHLFGNRLRKFTEYGDLAFGYFIWYGITRLIMEPMRHPSFNMGQGGFWSWIWCFGFIMFGCLGVFFNHLIRFLLARKNQKLYFKPDLNMPTYITFGMLTAIALGMIIPGIIMMANGTASTSMTFTPFNIGLMLLICGIGVMLFAAISGLNIYKRIYILKEKSNNEQTL